MSLGKSLTRRLASGVLPDHRAQMRARARRRRMRTIRLPRVEPYSQIWGFDRGLPVDRFYIERFVQSHRADVRGRVMEIQSPLYAAPFGGDRISSMTVVDVDPTNPHATLIGDLCTRDSLAEHNFDCEIVTQTLQVLPDVQVALHNLWGALAPHGVLLITVPCVSQIAPEFPDFWRFTPRGLEQLLRTSLPETAKIEVTPAGNLTACGSFLYGLSVENIGKANLLANDDQFPLVCCARIERTQPPAHA